jgi:hypothetical protein
MHFESNGSVWVDGNTIVFTATAGTLLMKRLCLIFSRADKLAPPIKEAVVILIVCFTIRTLALFCCLPVPDMSTPGCRKRF